MLFPSTMGLLATSADLEEIDVDVPHATLAGTRSAVAGSAAAALDSAGAAAQPFDTAFDTAFDTGLSERDRAVLEFERAWWKYAGSKEQAVRELFDMSATRYYQVLNALIDRPEALAADPMLVKRLRRMRASRARARSARRLGVDG
ncbi:MAG: DUF3263 domain-containing protein [Actinomycetales bacterium]